MPQLCIFGLVQFGSCFAFFGRGASKSKFTIQQKGKRINFLFSEKI
jgi:hypothetical protein